MNAQETITSRDNAKLKFARAVRDGREPGTIFVEGIRLVREAFRSNIVIEQMLVSADIYDTEKFPELRDLSARRGLTVTKVAPILFPSISDTESPQGVIALARRPEFSLAALGRRAGKGPVIFLHKVNNPSNLGAVVRTAEASDARAVIISKGSSDCFSPKAIRASMGSCLRLALIEGMALNDAITWANANGYIATAADTGASSSYVEIDWSLPRLLVLGSEAHGLSEDELSQIEEIVRIPMANGVESLNLAVSAGIIMFEANRQIERR